MVASTKAPAGHYTILYFASAGSYTSKDSEHLPAPLPLSNLFQTLEEKYGGIKAKVLDSCLVTINLEYVDIPDATCDGSEIMIKEGDEVAIIPPVSSG
jgi:molybdopterin converting factor small subunit